LPTATISNFSQPTEQFRSHFLTSRPTERDTSYLFTIKQKGGEPLKDYLGRFYKAMLEIRGVDSKVVVAAAKQGVLADSAFFNSISKNRLTTMEEFREKAEKYVLQEESINARKENEYKAKSTRGESSNQGDKGHGRGDKGRDRDLKRKYFLVFNEYTALRKPPHEILMEIKDSGLLPTPPQMRPNPWRKESNEYCKYHKAKGHDTSNC